MAFPASTNVDGSNPGPNSASLPDTVQAPTGNIWKQGIFTLALTPAAVAAGTTAEQIFPATGLGLLPGDLIVVNKPTNQPGLAVAGMRVSANDTLAITYSNDSGAAITPTPGEGYLIGVFRPQPNWTKPAVGNQFDW